MALEAQRDRTQKMELLKQALIDATLEHEQVVKFLEDLRNFLVRLERTDVEIITETRLKNDGVAVKVFITYDSLYNGQAARDPSKNTRMQQTEQVLLNALREEKINIGTGFLVGDGQSIKIHYTVYEATVNYQGEIKSA